MRNYLTQFTLWGIYQYDNTLFDEIVLPSDYNKELLIDILMERCGMLYVYQQEPTFLKRNINNFFKRNYYGLNRQMEAFKSEYSPIENYDRMEESEVINTSEQGGTNKSNSSASSSTKSETSAFNSSSFQPTGANHTQNSGGGESNFSASASGNTKTISRVHGNVGVTKNTDMQKEVIALYERDLYIDLVTRFEEEFLIRVY